MSMCLLSSNEWLLLHSLLFLRECDNAQSLELACHISICDRAYSCLIHHIAVNHQTCLRLTIRSDSRVKYLSTPIFMDIIEVQVNTRKCELFSLIRHDNL